jgi:hypothetical protein
LNIYRCEFISRCPNNREFILYSIEIVKPSDETIYVEHITIAAQLYNEAFHEQIADFFYKRFGGEQVLKAFHHGVHIETRRGFDTPDVGRLTKRVQVGSTVFEKGTEAKLAIEAISR